MNFKILAVYLLVPILVIVLIAVAAGCFGLKKKESIKGDVFEYFKQDWNAEPETADEAPFFRRFFDMFVQSYEYEKYKESANKAKYYFYKLLVLLIILCIPFLVLVLITEKEWILNDNEWNEVYLYTVILVPLVFAYLVNKYIKIKNYHETWYRHLKNRHHMEWRMVLFIKDYELRKKDTEPKETDRSTESLKIGFINDICEYWKAETAEISVSSAAKEENIFEDIAGLFGK